MKTVILCGGKGTRLVEETKRIPKPMVKIGKKPILEHIINFYIYFGCKHFILALGYKQKFIKDYFKNKYKKIKIEFINTGLNTLTGSRLKCLSGRFESNENFYFTYGDGLSNINLKKLLRFHEKRKNICTVTAVRPTARFGELIIKKNKVKKFREKPQVSNNWINGGFFILNSKIFNILPNKNHMFEKEPMTKLVKQKQIAAYKHYDKWQCMDTMRDKLHLNSLVKNKKAFWIMKK